MAERINQALSIGNVERIRDHRDRMTAAKRRFVTFDEALEDLLDKAAAYMALEQEPAQ
jgi:hypothetical protein